MKKVLVTLWVTVEVPEDVAVEDVVICNPTHFWLMKDESNQEFPVLDVDQVSEEEVED